MKGWTIVENRFVDTDDLEQIKQVMPFVIARLEALDVQLTDDLPEAKAEEVMKEIDAWFDRWNRNAEVIAYHERLLGIRHRKAEIKKLKWPPDEAGEAASYGT